jgi:hypothetical protein
MLNGYLKQSSKFKKKQYKKRSAYWPLFITSKIKPRNHWP